MSKNTKPGHSTGPRTPEGKAVSSLNAFKHGFRSSRFIVTKDREEDFKYFYERMRWTYKPVGDDEWIILENMTHDAWNLHRIRTRLASLADCGIDPLDNPDAQKEYDRLDRYQARAQSSFRSNLRELHNQQTNRAMENLLPRPFVKGTLPPMTKLPDLLSVAKRTAKEFPALTLSQLSSILNANRDDWEPPNSDAPLSPTPISGEMENEKAK